MIRRLLGMVALAVAAALLGGWAAGGSVLYRIDRAPDGLASIQLATPARWQWWQAHRFDMPAVARYVEPGGVVVDTSAPFELSGAGKTYWTRDGVSIGSSAEYDRRTRRWSVQAY